MLLFLYALQHSVPLDVFIWTYFNIRKSTIIHDKYSFKYKAQGIFSYVAEKFVDAFLRINV